MTAPVQPRPAATVVVLRPAGEAFEVLLLRRNDRVAFMAGAHVFPGGRVDEADHQAQGSFGFLQDPPRFADLTVHEELAYRHGATRELREEAALSVAVDDLLPIAHWVTPDIEPRRYDTRFFLTPMPAGQEARHDDGETIALAWWAPAEALARGDAGEIMLAPPTWTTLRLLERHSTLAAALAWARTTPVVRVEPRLVKDGLRNVLTLPGDPTYPAMPGWTVPRETRFVMEQGRGWLPVQG